MDSLPNSTEEPAIPGWAYGLGLGLIIAVNLVIFWYLLIFWPGVCADIVSVTAGRQSCGLEPGAYIVGGINIIIIAACIGFFLRWYQKAQT